MQIFFAKFFGENIFKNQNIGPCSRVEKSKSVAANAIYLDFRPAGVFGVFGVFFANLPPVDFRAVAFVLADFRGGVGAAALAADRGVGSTVELLVRNPDDLKSIL
jgi:hypothetical protein